MMTAKQSRPTSVTPGQIILVTEGSFSDHHVEVVLTAIVAFDYLAVRAEYEREFPPAPMPNPAWRVGGEQRFAQTGPRLWQWLIEHGYCVRAEARELYLDNFRYFFPSRHGEAEEFSIHREWFGECSECYADVPRWFLVDHEERCMACAGADAR